METADWIAYLSTLLVVVIAPGTSTMLVVAQTVQFGKRQALLTAAGDLTANAVQLIAVSVASAAILDRVVAHADTLKWGAAAYLVLTGFKLIASGSRSSHNPRVSSRSAYLTGFLVSISNPSAILFFALLLPLFIQEGSSALPQFAALGTVALIMDGLFLGAYIIASAAISKLLEHRRSIGSAHRVAGMLRIIAAFVLANLV